MVTNNEYEITCINGTHLIYHAYTQAVFLVSVVSYDMVLFIENARLILTYFISVLCSFGVLLCAPIKIKLHQISSRRIKQSSNLLIT